MSTVEWEQPLISVDVVPVKLNKLTREINIILGKRKFEPAKGEAALPGVLLLPNERATEAAMRALQSKVSIPEDEVAFLKDVGIADNPDRDPRGPSLSVVMLAVVNNSFNPEDEDVEVLTLKDFSSKTLPFDHSAIVVKALKYLDSLLMTDREASKAFLGAEFRTTDLHAAFTELHHVSGSTVSIPDLSNLSRTLKSNAWLATSTTTSTGTKGRPASSWVFADK